MAITSTESFLALLEKSQLLRDKDLEKVRAVAGKYGDAKSLALAVVAAKGLTRWQAGQLLAGRSSFMLGRYKLIDLLGRGGMGSVFAAEQQGIGRRVALKIISKQTGRDPEQLERFLSEARRIAALDHPNIVRAFDVDHEGERYFLVLEYVEGRDLQQIVESDGPLDVERAVRYVRQAASGLAHAHERKMIHCDIKPANLIVGEKDVVKILDMGMARLVEEDGSSSDSNENIIGTIDYISPEQALEAEDLDHRTDIYSLGCTLYFLLTSRPPFGEGTLAQRIMKHQTQAPRPISETRSGVPDGLAEVCMKMMAKKPGDRFETAAEVAQALAPWAGSKAGQGVAAKSSASEGMPVIKVGPAASEESPEGDDEPPVVELIDDEEGQEDEVAISIADSGSFAVRAGSSRGRRSNGAAKSAESGSDSDVPTGFFADPRKKWAAIGVCVFLVLGVAGGGLAMMFLGGDAKPEVAAQSVEAAPSQPAAAAAPASESLDTSLDADLGSLAGAFESEPEKAPAGRSTDAASETPAQPPATDPEMAKAATESATAPQEGQAAEGGGAASSSEAVSDSSAEKTGEDQEEKKPPEEKKEEPAPEKKESEKKAPEVPPFKDFPKLVDLPLLNENDPEGEGSKAAMDVGAIHGPGDLNWQMLLVGGDLFLRGGRKFTLARTENDSAKAAWLIQNEGDTSEKVARLWREGETLRFQWDAAAGVSANFLRNCFLQVRVKGESRYLALTAPVKAEPVILDLIRGQGDSSAALKWIPDDDLLRFKFDKLEGVERAVFAPSEPVAPKTQVALNVVYRDKYENDTNAVVFRVVPTTKKTSVSVDARLVNPVSRAFKVLVGNYNEQQLGTVADKMTTAVHELTKKADKLKGEEAQKAVREIDAMNQRIWYLTFFLQAHKKAALHYQVVADVGGQELVLVSTR